MNNIDFRKAFLVTAFVSFMVLAAGCMPFSSGYSFKGSQLDPPMDLPDFELMTDEGQSFHLSDTAGELTLVYFGYTFCPDVCPLTMADVKQALTEMEDKDAINVLFVSVDPERDTPEVLSRYLDAFGPEFMGLTDTMDKTQPVLQAFGAYAEKAEVENSSADYLMNHTARLYLVDTQGDLLLTYPFGFEPEDLRADLEYLLETSQS
ncbi:MAG: SCO family protein [Anaerolineae bacterium]|nr:SCO family protein [Anaerolineae bacterium]